MFKEMTGIPDWVELTFSYQKTLLLINSHLKTIYGDRADLKKCLDAYFHSSEYRNSCHNGKKLEDIKLLQPDKIKQMLLEEEQYSASVEKLEKCYLKFEAAASDEEKNKYIYELASILGILPENDKQIFFPWILQREGMTIHEKKLLHKKIAEDIKPLSVAAETLARFFKPGLLSTFPSVGSVMTQQRGKYFYRGENAFYRTSKASVYRSKNTLPNEIKNIVDCLRRDECWNFLDKFDAVKHWHWSFGEVNYIALAQHYGLWTQMIDITSDLKTALFFICCKFGGDRQWHPLQKNEIKHIDSREDIKKLGGDSRYGILYRTPAEITDIKWALADENAGWQIITPVGYQPFMRCSNQYSYMMLTNDSKYDMLCDPLFDIYKIRLDEDFCKLIYEQMNCGNKVYPNDDIPDISQEIEKLNKQTIFSEPVFRILMAEKKINLHAIGVLREKLAKHGIVIQGRLQLIDPERLKQINSQYTADIAQKKVNLYPQISPLMILSGDTLVDDDNNLLL